MVDDWRIVMTSWRLVIGQIGLPDYKLQRSDLFGVPGM